MSPQAPDRSELRVLQDQPWRQTEVPADAMAVPTMLSDRERQMLHWFARDYVTGVGRMVEAGCFLGGSTAALASGLAARNEDRWDRAIAVYDLFRVEQYTLAAFADCFPDPTLGASFRPAFDRYLSKWAQHLDVNEGNALDIGWTGEPIELLFVDMAKTWQLNDFVIDQFFPCLIPGHSIIIQQDYLWSSGPWIHITMELLNSSAVILDAMPNGSVAYLLTAPVPPEIIGTKLRNLLSPAQQMELMNDAVNRWDGEDRALLEISRARLLAERDPAAARAEFEATVERHPNDNRIRQSASALGPKFAGDSLAWLGF